MNIEKDRPPSVARGIVVKKNKIQMSRYDTEFLY
jgi:hypothetical protein